MTRLEAIAACILALTALAGCKRGETESGNVASEAVITIGKENIAVAMPTELRSGPAISGTLEARQAATVRAEVGGAVLKTYAEAGDTGEAGCRPRPYR